MKNWTVLCDQCGNVAAARLNDSGGPVIAAVANKHEDANPGHSCAVIDHGDLGPAL